MPKQLKRPRKPRDGEDAMPLGHLLRIDPGKDEPEAGIPESDADAPTPEAPISMDAPIPDIPDLGPAPVLLTCEAPGCKGSLTAHPTDSGKYVCRACGSRVRMMEAR